MQPRDNAYLWDIARAAQEILEFTTGMAYADFEKNRVVRYAVERQLLVIGEAANRLSDEAKSLAAEVPWKQIVGMRNVIAHEYGEIIAQRIWLTAREHVPPLLNAVNSLLSGSA